MMRWLVAAAMMVAACSSGTLANPGPGGARDASLDVYNCSGTGSYDCLSACSSDYLQPRVCKDGAWICKAPTVPVSSCAGQCMGVTMPCYTASGQAVNRLCSSGEWVCPPGSTMTWQPDAGRDMGADAVDGGPDGIDDAGDDTLGDDAGADAIDDRG
jgi:hypothetical protein